MATNIFGKMKLRDMRLKFNSMTNIISVVLLITFIVYSLTALGMAGTLFSCATGLIAYGMLGKLEYAMAITIITGILLKVLFPGFKGAAEGFEDASAVTVPITEQSGSDGEEIAMVPAPVHASSSEEKDKSVALAEAGDIAGFTDKASASGLFKLGELPSEAKDGNYIDVGTTIMKSLSALKPDQINQMTSDTKTLLETQKSLMTMLSSMKPMLADGQQLLSSFSGMFGAK
jgi:hypothetical protein